jgi:hypothetical protein
MAETFPAYSLTNLQLDPDLGITVARSEGGMIVTSRRADPSWTGQMTTRPLAADPINEHADFRAFLSRCADLNLSIDFVHPRHVVPRSYTIATWPLVTDCSLVSISDLNHIVVSGLTVGVQLKRGDRLSLQQTNVDSTVSIAHRWVAVDVTSASATAQAIEVTPRLPMGVFAASATVKFKNPPVRLRVIPGSWDDAEAGGPTAISFQVSEALR